jgi:hypothetical protein
MKIPVGGHGELRREEVVPSYERAPMERETAAYGQWVERDAAPHHRTTLTSPQRRLTILSWARLF